MFTHPGPFFLGVGIGVLLGVILVAIVKDLEERRRSPPD